MAHAYGAFQILKIKGTEEKRKTTSGWIPNETN